MAGRFIVFEGIDGSGKSTAIAAVAEALGDAVAWCTKEETDGPTGEAVRQAIAARAPPLSTTYLFLADRAQHVPQVRDRLAQGHVLCDRYAHSTLAYQSVTLEGHVADPLTFLRELHAPFDLWPDHVVLLDLPADVAVARAEGRGATTPYEKVAFLEQVRTAYLGLAQVEAERFTIVDAAQSPDQVAKDCLAAVREAVA